MRRIAVVLALGGALSCDGGLSPKEVVGEYELSKIAGEYLPEDIFTPDRQTVFQGHVSLKADGSYVTTDSSQWCSRYGTGCDNARRHTSEGTWSVDGDSVAFLSNGFTYRMHADGKALRYSRWTVNNNYKTFLYER